MFNPGTALVALHTRLITKHFHFRLTTFRASQVFGERVGQRQAGARIDSQGIGLFACGISHTEIMPLFQMIAQTQNHSSLSLKCHRPGLLNHTV